MPKKNLGFCESDKKKKGEFLERERESGLMNWTDNVTRKSREGDRKMSLFPRWVFLRDGDRHELKM